MEFNMSDNSFLFYSLDASIDSEQTGLDIRKRAMELLMQLRVNTEWAGEGDSAKKKIVVDIDRCLAMTTRFLKLKNPGKYGHIIRESQVYRLR
jgi:hypothetical protein